MEQVLRNIFFELLVTPRKMPQGFKSLPLHFLYEIVVKNISSSKMKRYRI